MNHKLGIVYADTFQAYDFGPTHPLKPTRLAAAEFEENRVRWDYGEEGGVLETAPESEAETGAAEAPVTEAEAAVSE